MEMSCTRDSFPIKNVQELASQNLKDIPPRFIQSELHTDEVSVNQSSQIPVIDMSKLVTGHTGYQTEMAKLHYACKDWGFFQLIHHGATPVIEKMKVDLQEFFKLPLEEKMIYAKLPNHIEGYGQLFVFSIDDTIDWNDVLYISTLPESKRDMRYWPRSPATFRSSLEQYSLELHKIGSKLCNLMATNLGVDFEEFSDMQKELVQRIRMNYYPPCAQADKVIGLSPHSDTSLLTLVVQANEVEGLQISKNDKWVPVKPLPGAIVVNIGDSMEIMSNGVYQSIKHRAVVNSKKERLSMAAFHVPSEDAEIGPLSELVKQTGAKYKTVKYGDYLKWYLSSRLSGKSLMDTVKINN